ncbi:MAG: hypothetical protein M3463_08925 [Verrucomicrobiota bacterium]|nr:hypothetical protein [Verrucomicrobiota bacterium]
MTTLKSQSEAKLGKIPAREVHRCAKDEAVMMMLVSRSRSSQGEVVHAASGVLERSKDREALARSV